MGHGDRHGDGTRQLDESCGGPCDASCCQLSAFIEPYLRVKAKCSAFTDFVGLAHDYSGLHLCIPAKTPNWNQFDIQNVICRVNLPLLPLFARASSLFQIYKETVASVVATAFNLSPPSVFTVEGEMGVVDFPPSWGLKLQCGFSH